MGLSRNALTDDELDALIAAKKLKRLFDSQIEIITAAIRTKKLSYDDKQALFNTFTEVLDKTYLVRHLYSSNDEYLLSPDEAALIETYRTLHASTSDSE